MRTSGHRPGPVPSPLSPALNMEPRMSDRLASPIRPDEPLPEGVEQAPRGARAMAMVRWGLVGLMAVAAAATWGYHAASSGVLSRTESRFHCPMHPSVVMATRGECPICGMDLVPIAGDVKAKAPDARAAAAGGAAGAGAGDVLAAEPARPQYTCPMHLAFVTGDPVARCPDCGMKLVPKEPAARAAEGVPGLAPVELAADRIQLMGMKLAVAARERLSSTIRTVGFVAPDEAGLVSVTTRFSGWVESVGVGQTGQLVEKGAVLATVYSPDLVNAQQVFLNAVKWSDRKAGGAPSAATNELERDARLRLELLGVAREDVDEIAKAGQPQQAMSIRSPVRGYVARKNVLKGLFLQPGTELFQIADLSRVWLLADVYESEIARVKVGQKARLELAAWPGEAFEGRVQFIYPALNAGSRTLQARIEFRNPGLKLRPGMYGDVTLEAGAETAVVIPREALVDTGETQYVFVARGEGRFEPRRVRAGWSGAGKVAILDGLAAGERVVTSANFVLDSESRLRAAIEGTAGATGRAP